MTSLQAMRYCFLKHFVTLFQLQFFASVLLAAHHCRGNCLAASKSHLEICVMRGCSISECWQKLCMGESVLAILKPCCGPDTVLGLDVIIVLLLRCRLQTFPAVYLMADFYQKPIS